MESKEKGFVTTSEIAKIFDVSRGSVIHWIKRGLIAAYRTPIKRGKYLIPSEELEKLKKMFNNSKIN